MPTKHTRGSDTASAPSTLAARGNTDPDLPPAAATPAKKTSSLAPHASQESRQSSSSSLTVSFKDPPTTIEDRYPSSSITRSIPRHCSSFLRPGSCFVGTQESGQARYDVNVELKYVDIGASFLCGYLRIQGLTPDHPMLTTYFEAEIIGPRYSFFTRRPEWSTSDVNDFKHWSRFPSWRAINKDSTRSEYITSKFSDRKYIFMRWKELFLVPDWKVSDPLGASYAGFYYICFNQVTGEIEGFYFHDKSDKFQRLDLAHVPDSGAWPTYEFR